MWFGDETIMNIAINHCRNAFVFIVREKLNAKDEQ